MDTTFSRVIVCGGRTYDDWKKVCFTLDAINPDVVIQGGAFGADRLAVKWAEAYGKSVVAYPANWRRGKQGGPIRNAFMLADSRPDALVAFPGGRGTDDMKRKAKEAGLHVVLAGEAGTNPFAWSCGPSE